MQSEERRRRSYSARRRPGAALAALLVAARAGATPCPNVLLVLDRSGSMNQDPSGGAAHPCREAKARSRLMRRLTVAARGRRLDDDRLAGIDDGRIAALQTFHAAAPAPHPVLADLPIAAACQSEWLHAAMAGKNSAFHFL